MKGKLQIYYDEEADFFEFNIGKYTEGYFKDISEGVSARVDEKTGEITGFAIMDFKKRKKFDLPVEVTISS